MPALHVLLPPLSRLGVDPEWRRWLARGDRLAMAQAGYLPALVAHFQWPDPTLPVAALTRDHLAGDAADALWLCADPASVQPDMTGARMLACGNLDLTAPEAAALARSLQPLFGDHGAALAATTPSRWHLRLPADAQLPPSVSPEQVLGDNLLGHLPGGADGRRWRTLFNEAQMLLHQHPVNAGRRERGQMPANSLWLWGGGSLPAWVKTTLTRVYGGDSLLQALAARARIVARPVADFATAGRLDGDALLDLSDSTDPRASRQVLQAALRRAGCDTLQLAFAGGERYRLRRRHRWRLWRRGI